MCRVCPPQLLSHWQIHRYDVHFELWINDEQLQSLCDLEYHEYTVDNEIKHAYLYTFDPALLGRFSH